MTGGDDFFDDSSNSISKGAPPLIGTEASEQYDLSVSGQDEEMRAQLLLNTLKHSLPASQSDMNNAPEFRGGPFTISQWTGEDEYGEDNGFAELSSGITSSLEQTGAKSALESHSTEQTQPNSWENESLLSNMSALSRMTGLAPESGSLVESGRARQEFVAEEPVIAVNPNSYQEKSPSLLRSNSRAGSSSSSSSSSSSGETSASGRTSEERKRAAEARDYDRTGLEELRPGFKSKNTVSRSRMPLILGALVGLPLLVFAGLFMVNEYAPDLLNGVTGGILGTKSEPVPQFLNLENGSTVRNLTGKWQIALSTTTEEGENIPFQTFDIDLQQAGRQFVGNGLDDEGNYSISGEIGDDGSRVALQKVYRGSSRFNLPLSLSGDLQQENSRLAMSGHFYAHIIDQSGRRARVSGQWQATPADTHGGWLR